MNAFNLTRTCICCAKPFVEERVGQNLCETCETWNPNECRMCGRVIGKTLVGAPELCAMCQATDQNLGIAE